MPPVRRLTAILAADVAGYSRLMGEDEEGTHERLKAHLRDLASRFVEILAGDGTKNTAVLSQQFAVNYTRPATDQTVISRCTGSAT